MSSREFCYWLQGAFENGAFSRGMSAEKAETVKKHLDMVFVHEIDKSYPDADKLNEIHNGTDSAAVMRC